MDIEAQVDDGDETDVSLDEMDMLERDIEGRSPVMPATYDRLNLRRRIH